VGNPCQANRDCSPGAICTEHDRCAPPSCTSAIDCGLEQVCIQGKCAPVGTPPPPPPDGGFPPPPPDAGPSCENLQCFQVTCSGGATTNLTGQVFDPSGQVPLYNAVVYVPNGQVQPIPAGLVCDRCGSPTSGDPLVSGLTDATGTFTLRNVPAGTSFPLVMQIGKWRRVVTIPAVPACTTTTMTDVNQQRLPRNRNEGDIPQMAIATGSADAFECLLLKMLDVAEFTRPENGGKVHMYVTPQGNPPPLRLDGGSPPATDLWLNPGTLSNYDVVLLPCEGSEFRKPDAGIQNLVDYTTVGGRLFVTHYSYVWTAFNPPFNQVANWVPDPSQLRNPPDPFQALIDTSFPKGVAFQDWLTNVGALTSGKISINDPRDDVGPVDLDAGTRWIYGPNPNNTITPITTQHLTWNTPVFPPPQQDGDAGVQCGRVVFSDFHVTADGRVNNQGNLFPQSCKAGAMTGQEKALVFMLFDVSSCVQDDRLPPAVCPSLNQSCSTTQPCCSGLTCLGQSFAPCVAGEPCSCQVPIN
jgi:hypothetical protein